MNDVKEADWRPVIQRFRNLRMGVYGDAVTAGGSLSVHYFGLWDFRACGGVTEWSAVFEATCPRDWTPTRPTS